MKSLQCPRDEKNSNMRHGRDETAQQPEVVAHNPFALSLLDTILAHMGQGVAVFDADLRLVIFNKRYVELFDYPPEIVYVGARYEDIVRFNVLRGDVKVEDVEAHVAQRLAVARDFNVERRLEHHRPNGRVISVDRGPIPSGGFINTYTDITKRQRIEEEAIRNAQLLRATLENMADGVRVFDKDMQLVAWNTKSLEMLNYPPEMGKVGTHYTEFVDYSTSRGDYRDEKGTEGREARLNRAKGARGRGSEFVSPEGRIIQKRRNPMPDGGFVSTYQDVTERKHSQMMLEEAKERAEQASRSKSEFLANMSHELRTPLNAIIGFSQIMCDELLGPLGGDKTYREYARDIKESGEHLMSIINDILDLSKIEAGKTQLNEQTVDLSSIVASCLRLMEERAAAGRLTLHAELPPLRPLLRCDERLMRQIILNLLSNAVKFTPPAGRITVTIAIDEHSLLLTVSDTGIGIAEADIPKAMAPFVQVDSSLSRKFSGTGLGLPLVDSFARLHGGSLAIKSRLGEGTSATVSLPLDRLVTEAS
jgi:signal transduction histidine kinase